MHGLAWPVLTCCPSSSPPRTHTATHGRRLERSRPRARAVNERARISCSSHGRRAREPDAPGGDRCGRPCRWRSLGACGWGRLVPRQKSRMLPRGCGTPALAVGWIRWGKPARSGPTPLRDPLHRPPVVAPRRTALRVCLGILGPPCMPVALEGPKCGWSRIAPAQRTRTSPWARKVSGDTRYPNCRAAFRDDPQHTPKVTMAAKGRWS